MSEDCFARSATPASACSPTTPTVSRVQFAISPRGLTVAGWRGSTRKQSLPPDWDKRREAQLRADGYRCTAIRADTGERCPDRANQADHVGDRLDHDRLTSLCEWHHQQKSGGQGGRAKAARYRATTRRHPGLVA